MIAYLITGLIAALLFVIFIMQNTAPVVVHFLMWKFEGSLALVLLLTLIIGVIICLLVAIPLRLRRKKMIAEKSTSTKSVQ